MQNITNTTSAAHGALPPYPIHKRWRFVRIFWCLLRIIIHIFIFDILGNKFWFSRWYARRSGLRRWAKMARRFRHVAVQSGGMMIKMGQFLSARADILPAVITDELAGLQDEVPAAPLPYVRQTLIEELGAPPETVFAGFDQTPVAAASLGQVYFATLRDGRSVAVKVQRPRIDEVVEVDLSAGLLALRLIKNYPAVRRRADAEALFEEFARVLREELDYEMEARNALVFREHFAGVAGVYFPEPYPDISTRRVLIMERVDGIKVNDKPVLAAAGVDIVDLSKRLNRAYQKQFFLDGFFHADPHPGNLLVRPEPRPADAAPGDPTPYTLIFLDSGMVGQLAPHTVDTLREGITGLATNDAERMVEAMERLHMFVPGTDRRPIIRAVQVFLRYTYDRSVRELTNMDVQAVFDDVEHLIRGLPFQLPQDLIYLGRAVSLVGGLATGLNPDINLFEESRPFVQELMARQQRDNPFGTQIRREVTELGQIAATLPRQMDAYFKAANRGELHFQVDLVRLERSMRRVERATNRLAGAVLTAAFAIGGVVLRINGLPGEAQWAWGLAALAALWMLWPRG